METDSPSHETPTEDAGLVDLVHWAYSIHSMDTIEGSNSNQIKKEPEANMLNNHTNDGKSNGEEILPGDRSHPQQGRLTRDQDVEGIDEAIASSGHFVEALSINSPLASSPLPQVCMHKSDDISKKIRQTTAEKERQLGREYERNTLQLNLDKARYIASGKIKEEEVSSTGIQSSDTATNADSVMDTSRSRQPLGLSEDPEASQQNLDQMRDQAPKSHDLESNGWGLFLDSSDEMDNFVGSPNQISMEAGAPYDSSSYSSQEHNISYDRPQARPTSRKDPPRYEMSQEDFEESKMAGVPTRKKRVAKRASKELDQEEDGTISQKRGTNAKKSIKKKKPNQSEPGRPQSENHEVEETNDTDASKSRPKTKSWRSRKAKPRPPLNFKDLTDDMMPRHPAGLPPRIRSNGNGSVPGFRINRMEALKELLRRIPDASKAIGRVGKAELQAAAGKLSHPRSIFMAESLDGWKMKGMRSTLQHFQLLGVSRMREFEKREDGIRGGILADVMGLGKTVSMLANMVDGRPTSKGEAKTTLIVVPPAILYQWRSEIIKHVEPHIFSLVKIWDETPEAKCIDAQKELLSQDIVITTYGQLRKSYPLYNPPLNLTPEEMEQWWTKTYENDRGALHRVQFYRVVLDECQHIKNFKSQTAIAARGLIAKHRWIMSGTIIENTLDEVYSFGRFLRAEYTNTYECFKHNFLKDDRAKDRLQQYLKSIMIRRDYDDRLLDKPIADIPDGLQFTQRVYFTDFERAIYNIVRDRCSTTIQRWVQSNAPHAKIMFWGIVGVQILRQLTGHILSCNKKTISQYLAKEDIPKLWQALSNYPPDTSEAVINKIKAALKKIEEQILQNSICVKDPTAVAQDGDNFRLGHVEGNDIPDGHCLDCGRPPMDPWITVCNHILCSTCLDVIEFDAAANDPYQAYCPAKDCGRPLDASRMVEESTTAGDDDERRKKSKKSCIDVDLIPLSTKLIETMEILQKWIHEDPTVKIVVFTQFLKMVDLIKAICTCKGWGNFAYTGAMSKSARRRAIENFQQLSRARVLVNSLRAGGVGLNLNFATRAILVDLYWNSAIEQQAFGRIHRIGQDSQSLFHRIAIRDTVDEKLIMLQERKIRDVNHVLHGRGMRRHHLTLAELEELFRPAGETLEGGDFVVPDEALMESFETG